MDSALGWSPHPIGRLAYVILSPYTYCLSQVRFAISKTCTHPLSLTRRLAGDDQGVTTPRVSCAQSSSSQSPDIRGAHPEVSGTVSVYSVDRKTEVRV